MSSRSSHLSSSTSLFSATHETHSRRCETRCATEETFTRITETRSARERPFTTRFATPTPGPATPRRRSPSSPSSPPTPCSHARTSSSGCRSGTSGRRSDSRGGRCPARAREAPSSGCPGCTRWRGSSTGGTRSSSRRTHGGQRDDRFASAHANAAQPSAGKAVFRGRRGRRRGTAPVRHPFAFPSSRRCVTSCATFAVAPHVA